MKKLKGKARFRARHPAVHPKHNSAKRKPIMYPGLNQVLALMTNWQIRLFNKYGEIGKTDSAMTFLNDEQKAKL
jgi:hypothetical protein